MKQLPSPEHCLNIPIPYLIQEFGLDALLKHTDDYGFGILHWAIGKAAFDRVGELISEGFDFSHCSKNHETPKGICTFDGYGFNDKHFIHFCPSGFTPLQLFIFLWQEAIIKKQNQSKGGHSIGLLFVKFENFFSSLPLEALGVQNSEQLSVTDFAFLSENLQSLECILKKDPTFTTLNKIKTQTAIKILENVSKSSVFNNYSGNSQFIEQSINTLKIVESKKKLEKTLPPKDNNSIIRKI